ncbi:hypothetical protein GCM10022279_15920 [Comamonas faecalis]|uniref:Efflux RND transporter periplasmic adaptor subunit n=2 Tax=Comamonas faecalis TaxID=1387849 RepID=A0ABP7R6M9_9BURK
MVISVAALLAVVAAGGWAWKHWSDARSRGPDYVFATAQHTDFEDLVSATGLLQPRDYVDVGAQVSGQLKKLHVEVGSEVTEGQLLAEIDAEQSQARVDASRASLRAQRAQLAQSRINLDKAERDLQRLRRLWKEDATTEELVQNAETTVAATRAQINTQKAQIEQLQATMRVEESNLKYTRIYAPIAGTVVSITAKQGQTLNTNQAAPIILRVADLSTMTVQTQVSEADVSRLRPGMQAYFTTLGSQGRRWYGTLRKIEPTPTVTNNVVLYNALFDVENPGQRLMSQMTAQVFFIVAQARDALVVPMAAVSLQRPGPQRGDGRPAEAQGQGAPRGQAQGEARGEARGERAGAPRGEARQRGMRGPNGGGAQQAADQPRPATVKVALDAGGVAEREVTVGVSNRVQAQILSGLQEGERVVVGTKQAEAAPRRTSAQQGPGLGGMGGMPPGGGRR